MYIMGISSSGAVESEIYYNSVQIGQLWFMFQKPNYTACCIEIYSINTQPDST